LCIDRYGWQLGGLSDKTGNGWISAIVAGTSWRILIKTKFAESETKIPIITKAFTEFFENEIEQSCFVKLFNLKRKVRIEYQNRIEELLQITEQLIAEQRIRDEDGEYIEEVDRDGDIHQIADTIIRNLGSSWVRKNLL